MTASQSIISLAPEGLPYATVYQEEQASQRHKEMLWAHERLWLLLAVSLFTLTFLLLCREFCRAAAFTQRPIPATVEDLSTLRYLIAEDSVRDNAALQKLVKEEARKAHEERAKRERDQTLILHRFTSLDKAIESLRRQPRVGDAPDPIVHEEVPEPLGIPGSSKKRTLVPLTRAHQPLKRRSSLRLQRQPTIISIPSTQEQVEEKELAEQLDQLGH